MTPVPAPTTSAASRARPRRGYRRRRPDRRVDPERAEGRASVITREQTVVCGIPYVDAVFRPPRAEGADRLADERGSIGRGGRRCCSRSTDRRGHFLTGERHGAQFPFSSCRAPRPPPMLLRAESRARDAGCSTLARPSRGCARHKNMGARRWRPESSHWALRRNPDQGRITSWPAGSIARAVEAARATGAKVPVEVEVENLEELSQAIAAGADIAMLDDFSLPDMATGVAVNRRATRPLKLEASGGVSLDTIRRIAETAWISFRSGASPSTCARSICRCGSSGERCAPLLARQPLSPQKLFLYCRITVSGGIVATCGMTTPAALNCAYPR